MGHREDSALHTLAYSPVLYQRTSTFRKKLSPTSSKKIAKSELAYKYAKTEKFRLSILVIRSPRSTLRSALFNLICPAAFALSNSSFTPAAF